jgi:hypothetical protein
MANEGIRLYADQELGGKPRVRAYSGPGNGNDGVTYAVIFYEDVQIHAYSAAGARELLAAAFEAVKILDPDGAVIVRASNQEIYLLEEILPGSEVTDPWQPPRAVAGPPVDLGDDPDGDSTPEPAPFTSPDLVTPPDAQPHLPDGSPNPYQTHSAASGITAPVETGEPWRGPAQADWDESR